MGLTCPINKLWTFVRSAETTQLKDVILWTLDSCQGSACLYTSINLTKHIITCPRGSRENSCSVWYFTQTTLFLTKYYHMLHGLRGVSCSVWCFTHTTLFLTTVTIFWMLYFVVFLASMKYNVLDDQWVTVVGSGIRITSVLYYIHRSLSLDLVDGSPACGIIYFTYYYLWLLRTYW